MAALEQNAPIHREPTPPPPPNLRKIEGGKGGTHGSRRGGIGRRLAVIGGTAVVATAVLFGVNAAVSKGPQVEPSGSKEPTPGLTVEPSQIPSGTPSFEPTPKETTATPSTLWLPTWCSKPRARG